MRPPIPTKSSAALIALVAVQAFCIVFFLSDVFADFQEAGGKPTSHLLIEAMAALTLIIAILFELRYMLTLIRRKERLEQSLDQASRAVFDVIESHFDDWRLSPAERDVAGFLVKGMSIAEIAQLRGNAEGTIKAHLNAIYRKSGTTNRGEMLSLLIDTLIGARPSA
ncbi:helix-turn-helix domain-containing protein [Celeribacter neptunius]|uniref:Regulatory protein, luxR family n=1 Tax=Celeribacter neptunius TaxID=588602 RepID=A0A1I3KEH5_9RHOB|nr:helix-turn-helix transcriptional regulator [Celeribacter neptunius]SFI70740.1 regulatory protein, luxR family [Celeribacter neptunius]